MRTMCRVMIGALVLWLGAGCATQEDAPPEVVQEDMVDRDDTAVPVPRLAETGIASFRSAAGTRFRTETIVTLPTGGPPSGRLVPTSSRDDVTLYVTRDGSVPSAANNWDGPIDPREPRAISRPLEGVASYRIVAEHDGEYSVPFTLTVIWEHEEDPQVDGPVFSVNGREVSGSVSIPVSDGGNPAARLEIVCTYVSSMLYITRDGTDPSVDNYWRSQPCDGTYIWSPDPSAAEYRALAVWRGVTSPVASLDVEWTD